MELCGLDAPFGGHACDFSLGMVDRIFLVKKEKISAIAYGDAYYATVTGITFVSASTKFNEIQAVDDSATYTDEFTVAGQNRYMTQSLNFTVNATGADAIKKAHQILLGKHIALVERADGEWRILGCSKGLSASAGSNNANADAAGKVFTLVGLNKGLAPVISEALALTLIDTYSD